jgi:hypothetical protein
MFQENFIEIFLRHPQIRKAITTLTGKRQNAHASGMIPAYLRLLSQGNRLLYVFLEYGRSAKVNKQNAGIIFFPRIKCRYCTRECY